MQLRLARLCLDCEEVHDAQRCPVCASEMFASITRWVPAPERRALPRSPTSSQAAALSALIQADARQSNGSRRWKQGILGLTAVGLLGWFMRSPGRRET